MHTNERQKQIKKQEPLRRLPTPQEIKKKKHQS